MRPVNLAAQPFRNARLPRTAFVAGAVLLAAVTAWHAVAIVRLLPRRTSALHGEVARLEQQVREVRAEARALPRETPPKPTLERWALVKDIVDQRAFSWTLLFERLEAVIPDGVRLVSIQPEVRRGQVRVSVAARVRSPEDGWEFVRALEQSGDFTGVFPTSETGEEFQYVMQYRPRPRPAASPVAADDSRGAAPDGEDGP